VIPSSGTTKSPTPSVFGNGGKLSGSKTTHVKRLGLVRGSVVMPKRRRNREPQSENTPIPERFISSHKPDPTLEWCAKCQSHTKEGKITVFNERRGTYEAPCCKYCKARFWWASPLKIQQSVNWMLWIIAGTVVIVTIELVPIIFFRSEWIPFFSICLGVFLPLWVGMLIWFLCLRWQWRNWLSQQPQNVDE
jgi:hypothetical protein